MDQSTSVVVGVGVIYNVHHQMKRIEFDLSTSLFAHFNELLLIVMKMIKSRTRINEFNTFEFVKKSVETNLFVSGWKNFSKKRRRRGGFSSAFAFTQFIAN